MRYQAVLVNLVGEQLRIKNLQRPGKHEQPAEKNPQHQAGGARHGWSPEVVGRPASRQTVQPLTRTCTFS